MVEIQLYDGPMDGLITAADVDEHPKRVVFVQLASGRFLDPSDTVMLSAYEARNACQHLYERSHGRRYRYKGKSPLEIEERPVAGAESPEPGASGRSASPDDHNQEETS